MTTTLSTNRDLGQLAADINREHRAAESAARTAIEHALTAGRLLNQAKSKLRHGEFLPWLSANCEVKERQARNYMKLAINWEHIEAKTAPGADLTIKGALGLLSGPKKAEPRFTPSVDVYLDGGIINQGHAYQIDRLREWFPDTTERLVGDNYPFQFATGMDMAMFLAAIKPEQSPPILLMSVASGDHPNEATIRRACVAFCDRANSLGWDDLPVWERHALWWSSLAATYPDHMTVDRLATGMANWHERVMSAAFWLFMHGETDDPSDMSVFDRWHFWAYRADARHAGIDSWLKDRSRHIDDLTRAFGVVSRSGSYVCPSEYQPWNAGRGNYDEYHAALERINERVGRW